MFNRTQRIAIRVGALWLAVLILFPPFTQPHNTAYYDLIGLPDTVSAFVINPPAHYYFDPGWFAIEVIMIGLTTCVWLMGYRSDAGRAERLVFALIMVPTSVVFVQQVFFSVDMLFHGSLGIISAIVFTIIIWILGFRKRASGIETLSRAQFIILLSLVTLVAVIAFGFYLIYCARAQYIGRRTGPYHHNDIRLANGFSRR
jgi:hypothetical protein